MDRKRIKIDWNIIIINVLLIGIYVLSFWMITESGYRCDDCYNANIIAYKYLTGDTVWNLTISGIIGWMEEGRFFPFSGYTYLIFSILRKRWTYKFAILVFTYLNSLLFGKMLEELTQSKRLRYMVMMLFPICIPLSCEYNNGLYSYHMLMHMEFLWLTVSMIFLIRYSCDKKWYLGVLGGVTFFLALGTYEVAFVFLIPLVIIAWSVENTGNGRFLFFETGKQTCIKLKHHLVAYGLAGGINAWLRVKSTSGYDGTMFNLEPAMIVKGFEKQVSAGVPLVRYMVTVGKDNGWKDEIWLLLHSIHWRQIVIVILYIFCVLFWVKLKQEKEMKSKQRLKIILIGLCILCLPAAVIALSKKYQIETQWGMGHLPAYIEAYGFTLIIACAFLWVYQLVKKRCLKMVVSIVCSCTMLGILVVNQFMGWTTVESDNIMYRYPRDCLESAVDCGILNDIDDGERLVTTTDYVMDYLGPELLYSKIAERAIVATNINNVSNIDELYGNQMIYTYANASGGYCMVGKAIGIEDDENQIQNLYVADVKVYMYGSYALNDNLFQLDTMNDGKVDLCKMTKTILNENDKGVLYDLPGEIVELKSLTQAPEI